MLRLCCHYTDTKNCSCKKDLLGKLNVKNNCLINAISLIVIYLLLIDVSCVSCYFYYTKYRSKQKHLLPYNNTSIKLDEITYSKYFIKMNSDDALKKPTLKIARVTISMA